MKRWTSVFALAASLLIGSLPLFAQLASDPNDRMYTDLKLWEDRGILQNLPQLRPYPIQLLKKLLSDVQDKGDANDAARAREYFSEMDHVIDIHTGIGVELRTDTRSRYWQITFGGPFQGSIDPLISYSSWLAGVANNGPGGSLLPGYGRSPIDYIYDQQVAPLGDTNIIPRVSSESAASFGSDRFWFQAGDIRGSWGPFWGENAVLSPSAPQSGQFSIAYRGEKFTAQESVMAISAVNSDGTGGPFPSKFLALHGLELYPLPWLTLGIFESVVWGGRFEILYLLPYAVHYYTQGFVAFPDNSFIGINASLKLPEAVRVDFLAYFDDMSFNNIIKLNLNTKMKFAAQGGVSWTPNYPLLARLSLEALMVTPYTYTHTNGNGDMNPSATGTPPVTFPPSPNYQDYTNGGQNMGPSLEPDSLRVEIKALLRPDPVVDVNAFARMILHGNASTNSPTPYAGTGTIFDNGDIENAFGNFRFLDQAVIQKTFQLGADSSAWFKLPFGKLQVYASYTFEYILNPFNSAGVPASATALNNYLSVGFFYRY
jgi:hypothetical protein